MEVIPSSERWVTTYKAAWCHSPQEHCQHLHHEVEHKFQLVNFCVEATLHSVRQPVTVKIT